MSAYAPIPSMHVVAGFPASRALADIPRVLRIARLATCRADTAVPGMRFIAILLAFRARAPLPRVRFVACEGAFRAAASIPGVGDRGPRLAAALTALFVGFRGSAARPCVAANQTLHIHGSIEVTVMHSP